MKVEEIDGRDGKYESMVWTWSCVGVDSTTSRSNSRGPAPVFPGGYEEVKEERRSSSALLDWGDELLWLDMDFVGSRF